MHVLYNLKFFFYLFFKAPNITSTTSQYEVGSSSSVMHEAGSDTKRNRKSSRFTVHDIPRFDISSSGLEYLDVLNSISGISKSKYH